MELIDGPRRGTSAMNALRSSGSVFVQNTAVVFLHRVLGALT